VVRTSLVRRNVRKISVLQKTTIHPLKQGINPWLHRLLSTHLFLRVLTVVRAHPLHFKRQTSNSKLFSFLICVHLRLSAAEKYMLAGCPHYKTFLAAFFASFAASRFSFHNQLLVLRRAAVPGSQCNAQSRIISTTGRNASPLDVS
jgi:hypothetical protein